MRCNRRRLRPRPQGRAALARGITEARVRKARLVVVNTSRGDSLVDERYVQGAAATAARGARGRRG